MIGSLRDRLRELRIESRDRHDEIGRYPLAYWTLAAQALDWSRRSRAALWSPLAHGGPIAFPNVERDPEIQRRLDHHEQIPRTAARAVVAVVRLGFVKGLDEGLAAERREFARLVVSEEGRAGIDRFLARRSLPLPLRRP